MTILTHLNMLTASFGSTSCDSIYSNHVIINAFEHHCRKDISSNAFATYLSLSYCLMSIHVFQLCLLLSCERNTANNQSIGLQKLTLSNSFFSKTFCSEPFLKTLVISLKESRILFNDVFVPPFPCLETLEHTIDEQNVRLNYLRSSSTLTYPFSDNL